MRCHFPCLFKMLFSLIWQADLFSICYDVNWRSTKNLIRPEEIGLLCSLHSTWYQLMVSLPLAIWYLTESAQQTPQYQFVQSKFITAAQCAIVKETFRYRLGRVKAVFFHLLLQSYRWVVALFVSTPNWRMKVNKLKNLHQIFFQTRNNESRLEHAHHATSIQCLYCFRLLKVLY